VKLTLSVAMLAFVAMAGCGTRSVCPPPTVEPDAGPLLNEPLGGACGATSDCSSGGLCAQLEFPFLTTCTVDCQSTACPTGTACALAQALTVDGGLCGESFCSGGFNPVPVCLEACASDGDCQQGARAGRCGSIDGGAAVCQPVSCFSDTQCPAAYFCTGAFSICCEPGQACPEIASRPGWCRRRP
jgi:hypothetical protein